MDVTRLDLERVNEAEKLLHEFENFRYCLEKRWLCQSRGKNDF